MLRRRKRERRSADEDRRVADLFHSRRSELLTEGDDPERTAAREVSSVQQCERRRLVGRYPLSHERSVRRSPVTSLRFDPAERSRAPESPSPL